jgi:hypothetical protein
LGRSAEFRRFGFGGAAEAAKRARNQFLTGQFPTHPNREFFATLQGIKLGDQGNFRPDQGIPALVRYLVPLPCRKSDRRDYMTATENQKRRLGEFVKSLVENTKIGAGGERFRIPASMDHAAVSI